MQSVHYICRYPTIDAVALSLGKAFVGAKGSTFSQIAAKRVKALSNSPIRWIPTVEDRASGKRDDTIAVFVS